MKKTLLVLLPLSLLLTFAGCSLPAENTPDITQDTTTQPTYETTEETETTISQTHEEFEQKPMIAVSLPVVEQIEHADDGTEIFRYSYQNMSLIVPDPEVADKVIVDFLNRIDQTADYATQILSAAKTVYTNSEQWIPYICQIAYNPTRIDTSVLSLIGSYTNYSGLPHPEKYYPSVNYDLMSGNVLRFDDIITDDSATNTIYQYIIEELNTQKEENALYEGFEETVKERLARVSSDDDFWYFSQNGLCFYFWPYEIAPYASGIITAEIPYNKLTGILNDAYFPSETECGSSEIITASFSEEDLSRFTQFSEVVLDTSGNKILLYTEGAVNHIQIENGIWNAEGTQYFPEQTVFAAYSLTPGDAIMVESEMTNTLPALRLTYNTANGTVKKYIAFNNNQPIFIDAT